MAAVTCQDICDLFSAHVDDALSAEERERLRAHLATCAECAREWERFAHTVRALRAVAPARAPAGFVDRVLAARPRPWYRRLAPGLLVPWSVKLPAGAAAVMLVAGLAILLFQHSPELRQATREPEPPAAVPTPPAMGPLSLPRTERAPVSGEATPERGPDDEATRHARAANEARKAAAALARDAEQRESPSAAAGSGVLRAESPAASAPGEQTEQDADGGGAQRPAAPAIEKSAELKQRAAVQSQALGRLAVTDRDAAERAVRDLVTRVGGQVIARATDADATVLTLAVPGGRWDEVQRRLRDLGSLYVERSRDNAGGPVEVTLRLER